MVGEDAEEKRSAPVGSGAGETPDAMQPGRRFGCSGVAGSVSAGHVVHARAGPVMVGGTKVCRELLGAFPRLVGVHSRYMARSWIVLLGEVGGLESCHASSSSHHRRSCFTSNMGSRQVQCWSRRFNACSASANVATIASGSRR